MSVDVGAAMAAYFDAVAEVRKADAAQDPDWQLLAVGRAIDAADAIRNLLDAKP